MPTLVTPESSAPTDVEGRSTMPGWRGVVPHRSHDRRESGGKPGRRDEHWSTALAYRPRARRIACLSCGVLIRPRRLALPRLRMGCLAHGPGSRVRLRYRNNTVLRTLSVGRTVHRLHLRVCLHVCHLLFGILETAQEVRTPGPCRSASPIAETKKPAGDRNGHREVELLLFVRSGHNGRYVMVQRARGSAWREDKSSLNGSARRISRDEAMPVQDNF